MKFQFEKYSSHEVLEIKPFPTDALGIHCLEFTDGFPARTRYIPDLKRPRAACSGSLVRTKHNYTLQQKRTHKPGANPPPRAILAVLTVTLAALRHEYQLPSQMKVRTHRLLPI